MRATDAIGTTEGDSQTGRVGPAQLETLAPAHTRLPYDVTSGDVHAGICLPTRWQRCKQVNAGWEEHDFGVHGDRNVLTGVVCSWTKESIEIKDGTKHDHDWEETERKARRNNISNHPEDKNTILKELLRTERHKNRT